MTPKTISTSLTSIEEELKVLKAQLHSLTKPVKKNHHSFTNMEGIWKGKVDFAFEEIQQARVNLRNTC